MNTALRKYPRFLASLLGGVLIFGAQSASAADAAEAPEAAPAAAESDLVIAGLNPSQRPAGAPVISEVVKGDGWYQQALHGVSKPYPASLRFLEDQGNWDTPFIVTGMTAPYDIRDWHQ